MSKSEMSLVRQIPNWLKWIFRFVGLLQVSHEPTTKIFFKLLPLPFWCYHFKITLMALLYFSSVQYLGVQNILKYSDAVACFTASLSSCSYFVVFYKRNYRLEKLIESIDAVDDLVTKSTPERTRYWSRNILLSLMFVNLLLVLCGISVLITIEFHLMYYNILILYGLEVVFMEVFLNSLKINIELINSSIIKEKISIELTQLVPQTNPVKVRTVKNVIVRIQELSHRHYQLTNLIVETNRVFEITMLAGIATWFTNLITEAYYIIYMIPRLSDSTSGFILTQILWTFYYCQLIYFQIRMWNDVQNEANKTVIYVHDIWNMLVSNGEINSNVRHLQLISTRLMGTKLEATVKGYFPLNWTFFLYCNVNYCSRLFSLVNCWLQIISAVATYVIILIQFKF
jgi:hypothetical protein